ncbi:MAG: hypothetical protein K8S00_12020 [Bacteroidales bacterium]|nr:hypothetical protein [Bacteroidales bacterium]
MKKLILLFALIIMSGAIMAQQQMTHEKRTYVAPNGNFYIQKALPVYLWLSTSKTADAKSHLLESKVTEKYTNPFYFDTEGKNTIRTPHAVDPNTKKFVQPLQDIIFEVYADGIAPASKTKFAGAPKYVKGNIIYYGVGLTVSVTSSDAVSGVEKTLYSIDGAAYANYSATLNMNKENQHTLKYYAADNVGNAENPKSKTFTVDLTSPKTTYAVSDPKLGDIVSPKAKITLSKTDNLSGVRNTKYYFDTRSPVVYYNPIALRSLSDGDHSFTYYSTDNVNNVETKLVYNFYLDKIPPVTTNTIQGDQYTGNYKYVSARTTINLASTDNKAGVESITYLIDGTGKTTFSSPFKVPDKKGLHTISYYGTDKVTNRENTKYLKVYMDNVPPTTGIIYGKPQFFDRDTLFINQNTKVTLTPKDYESGVKITEYTVDGSKSTYNSPFTIPNEGYRKITFHATDRVNNVEQVKESAVFVDNTPPVIYHNFSIKAINRITKNGKTYDVYPNYTRIFLGATDKKCGTQKIQYSINGAAFKDYSSPYTLDVSELLLFKSKKLYTVTVKAKDKLGNESEKVIEFYVGNE